MSKYQIISVINDLILNARDFMIYTSKHKDAIRYFYQAQGLIELLLDFYDYDYELDQDNEPYMEWYNDLKRDIDKMEVHL